MRKEILLLTESDGFFGQWIMPWQSIAVDRLTSLLSEHFTVKRVTYAAIASGAFRPERATIIHSSSQQPEYKCYIDDILLYLASLGNRLVPSLHITRCHENKGYQELYKRLRNIRSLPGSYYCKPQEVDVEGLNFPVVLKEVSGFGSSGVHLVRSLDELRQMATAERRLSLREAILLARQSLGNVVRKHVLRRKNVRAHGDYYEPLKRFVLQPFISGLDCDYKVLAFQNKLYVLRRGVRRGDFRASGSGIFQFEIPPESLLNFAAELLEQFDEPYMSFDICCGGSVFHLLEFQGVHFGPLTVVKAPMFFSRETSGWKTVFGESSFEAVLAESLVTFLKKRVLGS